MTTARAADATPAVFPDGLVGRTRTTRIHVAMGDVDAHQVHFVAHFRFVDGIESQFFAELGFSTSRILAEGFGLPIVEASCRYVRGFGLDEVIEVHSQIASVGTTSLVLEHGFVRPRSSENEEEELAHVRTVHVCVQRSDGRKTDLGTMFRALGLMDETQSEPRER